MREVRVDWAWHQSLGQWPLSTTELLNSLMVVGTKDLLWRSVLEHNAVNRLLWLLLCSIRVWWRLSMMSDKLIYILLSTTTPSESRHLPSTEPAFRISLSRLLVSLSVALPPQQTAA